MASPKNKTGAPKKKATPKAKPRRGRVGRGRSPTPRKRNTPAKKKKSPSPSPRKRKNAAAAMAAGAADDAGDASVDEERLATLRAQKAKDRRRLTLLKRPLQTVWPVKVSRNT